MAFIYNPNKTSSVIIYGYSGQGNYDAYITGWTSPYVFTVWGDANFMGRIFYNGVPLLTQNDTALLNPIINSGTIGVSSQMEVSGTNLQNQINNIKNNTGQFIKNNSLNGLISSGATDLKYSTITNLTLTGSILNSSKLNTGLFIGFTKLTISSGAPQNPNEGDLWIDLS